MLEPFRAIIDGDEPPPPGSRAPDAEELIRALQVMLKAQVVYADTPGIGRAYELAATTRRSSPTISRASATP